MQNNSILEKFFGFYRNPVNFLELENKESWKLKTYKIFQLVCVAGTVAFVSAVFSSFLTNTLGYSQTDNNKVFDFIESAPLWLTFLLIVFFGPILEELAFRLFLTPQKKDFLLGFGFLLYFLWQLFFEFIDFWIPNPVLSLLLFLAGVLAIVFVVVFCFKKISSDWLKKHLTKRFGLFVWSVTILFGFIHLTNFEKVEQFFFLAPILVLPQLFAGTILNFVRVYYSFFWTCVTHILYNFLLSLAVFVYAIAGEKSHLEENIGQLNSGNFQSMLGESPNQYLQIGSVFLSLVYLIMALTALSTISPVLARIIRILKNSS